MGVWGVPANLIGPWGMQGGLKGYKGMQGGAKGDKKQGKGANQIMDIRLYPLTSLSHFPILLVEATYHRQSEYRHACMPICIHLCPFLHPLTFLFISGSKQNWCLIWKNGGKHKKFLLQLQCFASQIVSRRIRGYSKIPVLLQEYNGRNLSMRCLEVQSKNGFSSVATILTIHTTTMCVS